MVLENSSFVLYFAIQVICNSRTSSLVFDLYHMSCRWVLQIYKCFLNLPYSVRCIYNAYCCEER